MNNVADKQIADCGGKIALLVRELQDTPLFERVGLWIKRMTSGRKLSEYLHDDSVPAKDRLTVARSLVDLLLQKQYDRLPEVEAKDRAPAPDPAAASAPEPDSAADEPEMPAPDELRAMIRQEIRSELARTLEIIAAAIRKSQ